MFDEILFKKPPPREDCPICMLQLPSTEYIVYQMCCGKVICYGCLDAMGASDDCPFCRKPAASSGKESIDRLNKRMKAGDADAFNMMGTGYLFGTSGSQKDTDKALEMYLRAAELGSVEAHNNICSNVLFWTIGCRNRSREVHVSLSASSNRGGRSFKEQSWEFRVKCW